MRTMYDSVTPTNIPINAVMVAGYAHGRYAWTQAHWDRFPHAVKVRIAVRANYFDAHVLDCEIGDATPAECPDWALTRRRMGGVPIIYCNRSTWPMVQGAFRERGIEQPLYWIATANRSTTILPGAIGVQHTLDYRGVDISSMQDFIPGIDGTEDMPFTPDDFHAFMWGNVFDTQGNRNFAAYLKDSVNALLLNDAKETALLQAIEAATSNPEITVDEMKRIVNDAVAAHVDIKLTGNLSISNEPPV